MGKIFNKSKKEENEQNVESKETIESISIDISKETYEVKNDCPNCGAKSNKIEKALNSGQDYKKPSINRILERMKKAGLPTRI